MYLGRFLLEDGSSSRRFLLQIFFLDFLFVLNALGAILIQNGVIGVGEYDGVIIVDLLRYLFLHVEIVTSVLAERSGSSSIGK